MRPYQAGHAKGRSPATLQSSNEPTAFKPAVFRLPDCTFPRPDLYAIEFWYNEVKPAE